MPGLSDCGVEMLMWLFLKNHPACFLLREQREEDEDGNEPNHFCFPFRRRFALSSAGRSLASDRATMRLRLRDNNRGRYTNTHVVLHVSCAPDEREKSTLIRKGS
jgi:hypothetical protein